MTTWNHEPADAWAAPPPAPVPTGPADDGPLYGASLGEAVRRFFQRYATFSGRASRSEYWWVVLFHVLVYLGTCLVMAVLAGIADGIRPAASTPDGSIPAAVIPVIVLGALLGLYLLAVAVPMIALRTRRLHDANFSGWLQLLLLVPVAELVVLVFTVLPSNPAGYRYDQGAQWYGAGYAPYPPSPPYPSGYGTSG